MSGTGRAITANEKRVLALDEAIAKAGGIVLFAASMGASCRQVYSWRADGYVPIERAIAIEAIFGVDHKRLVGPGVLGPWSGGFDVLTDELD